MTGSRTSLPGAPGRGGLRLDSGLDSGNPRFECASKREVHPIRRRIGDWGSSKFAAERLRNMNRAGYAVNRPGDLGLPAFVGNRRAERNPDDRGLDQNRMAIGVTST